MSYEIVYKRQFLKIDGKIIPLVLYGSNNCYTTTWSGRERRERDWHPMYFGRNTMIANTEEQIMEKIQSCCDGSSYQEHFMRSGKWVDDAGLVRFFKNGIKDAKTIEELEETYFFYGLTGYFSVWSRMENTIENRVSISTSDDLRNYLVAAQKRLDEREEKEEVYICLKYNNEDFRAREPKVLNGAPKEKLTDFYAIKVDNAGYLFKLTRRRIRYCYNSNGAKQFKTQKDAAKYIERIKERFCCSLDIEHIVAV